MIKPRFLVFAIGFTAAIQFTFSTFGAEPSGRWKPLFNGRNLDGWDVVIGGSKSNDPARLVQVENGTIHMYRNAQTGTPQPAGYIATKNDYTNYHLRLQYQWGKKKFAPRTRSPRDAGVLYKIIGKDGVWPTCVECQIQENDTGDVFTIHTRLTAWVDPKTTNITVNVTTNGSGIVAEKNVLQPVYMDLAQGGVCSLQGAASGIQDYQRIIRRPMNEQAGWNSVEIIVQGDEATYLVNGKVNNKTTKIEQWKDNQWIPLKNGKIGLQMEYAEIYYRNVEIKELE